MRTGRDFVAERFGRLESGAEVTAVQTLREFSILKFCEEIYCCYQSVVYWLTKRMQTLTKVGLAVFSAGILIWAFPFLWYGYATEVPINNLPFPLEAGSVFEKEFSVRTSQNYFLNLGCRAIKPLDYSLTDFLSSGSSSPRIPCDLNIQFFYRGKAISSEVLSELRPSSFSSGTGFWHLAHCELPSAGRYRLVISNGSDLMFLGNTSPVLKLDVGEVFYKDAIFDKILGFAAGVPIAASGIFLFLWDRYFLSKSRTLHTSARDD